MRISYNWLRELLPGLDASPSTIAETLTNVGLEVEAVIEVGAGLDALELCVVRAIDPIPDRDKLRLVTIDRGHATQQVVCGASNVPDPGGLVVLAPLGTTLPAIGLTLTPRKLGGVMSEGMLCSETELGLGSDARGILTFEAGRFTAGTRLSSAFPHAQDTVFELGITPNRPDALGHIGVARDLAAALKLDLREADVEPSSALSTLALDELVTLENRAKDRCPRYGAAAVMGVHVGPSPEWLRWRLSALGVRPISNVVDITNLLLLEYGNPMHAFDMGKVAGHRIVIRTADAGECLTTLDGNLRELSPDDLVIADGERASALAGVMGGRDSEITESTTDVLLECAYFEPRGIRRTSRRLGLHSDSSYRFERGVDWGALPRVLTRACKLLGEIAGAKSVSLPRFADGEAPPLPVIELRHQRLQALLGVEVPFAEALDLLGRLGLASESVGAGVARVRGASFRPDITLEADLIEEVARIRGLDQIPTRLPRIAPQTPSPAGELERDVRRLASSLGLSEAITYAFVSPEALQAVSAPAPVVSLKHPLSSERSVMTTSLLPGLLECVMRATRHGENDVRMFTIGSRFLAPLGALPTALAQAARPRAPADVGHLPEERLSFAAVLAGDRPAYLRKPEPLDVYDAKGVAVELVERLSGQRADVRWAGQSPAYPALHPRGAGEVLVGDVCVGCFGPLHPDVSERLELDGAVQIVELDLVAVEALGRVLPKYKPIPRLPPVTRDLAVEADEGLTAGEIQSAIVASAGELCESVQLFDVFRNAEMRPGARSLAFRLVYRDPRATTQPSEAETLTDKRVDKQHAKVVAAIERLGASLRV